MTGEEITRASDPNWIQFNHQRGLCAFTEAELYWPTLDRVDPNEGYTLGNCVITFQTFDPMSDSED